MAWLNPLQCRKGLARAGIESDAWLGGTLLPSSHACWQPSVPFRAVDSGRQFLAVRQF